MQLRMQRSCGGAFEEICIADFGWFAPYEVIKGSTVSSAAIMKRNTTQTTAE